MSESPPAANAQLRTYTEFAAWFAGFVCLGLFLAHSFSSQARTANAVAALPDMQLWSASRRASYLAALEETPGALLGTLEVQTLSLQVPVYESASDLHMDLGAGIIDGMSYPHEAGHIGIAGHRDGYFRVLKDLAVGDLITLNTLKGTKRFVVDALLVIEADEVEYLAESDSQRLSIVTCYPFYFLGSAPQRFLVRAAPLEPEAEQHLVGASNPHHAGTLGPGGKAL